jgi:hypothetical protein
METRQNLQSYGRQVLGGRNTGVSGRCSRTHCTIVAMQPTHTEPCKSAITSTDPTQRVHTSDEVDNIVAKLSEYHRQELVSLVADMNEQERRHKEALDQMERRQAATIAKQQVWLEAICKATCATLPPQVT